MVIDTKKLIKNMFTPKTDRIKKLAELFPKNIENMSEILRGSTKIYIDWQNVIYWQEKLGWHFSLKRLKQFFDSFDTVQEVIIYTGTLEGDEKSEKQIKEIESCEYVLSTKPVKLIKISIDTTSIPDDSPAIMNNLDAKHARYPLRLVYGEERGLLCV